MEACDKATIKFVEKFIIISWFRAFLEVKKVLMKMRLFSTNNQLMLTNNIAINE